MQKFILLTDSDRREAVRIAIDQISYYVPIAGGIASSDTTEIGLRSGLVLNITEQPEVLDAYFEIITPGKSGATHT